MAGWYTAALDAILGGDVDLINDPVGVMLVDTSEYLVDLDTHATQSDVPEAAVLVIADLTGGTVLDGVYRANDVVFSSVEAGNTAGALIIYVNKETYADSLLLAYIDNAPEFPVDTDGEDVSVYWDPVAGIMAL